MLTSSSSSSLFRVRSVCRRVLRLCVLSAAVLLTPACSSDEGGMPPRDQWFRGVMAGDSGGGADVSGSVDVIKLHPDLAAMRTPGSPGADGTPAVVVIIYLPGGSESHLMGTWSPDGSYTATGDGWTVSGDIDGTSTRGGFMGPSGETGEFAGIDAAEQTVGRFCGSYEGGGSGAWNFVVSEAGDLEGSFSGTAFGGLTGSVSGDTATIHWSGQTIYDDAASGSAGGTISPDGSVTGTWQGRAGDLDVSGTWSSGGGCPGPDGPVEAPPSSSGSCCHGGALQCCGPMCCVG